jgi:hypothetical protein
MAAMISKPALFGTSCAAVPTTEARSITAAATLR